MAEQEKPNSSTIDMADVDGGQVSSPKAKRHKTEHKGQVDCDKKKQDNEMKLVFPSSLQNIRYMYDFNSEQSTENSESWLTENKRASRKHRKGATKGTTSRGLSSKEEEEYEGQVDSDEEDLSSVFSRESGYSSISAASHEDYEPLLETLFETSDDKHDTGYKPLPGFSPTISASHGDYVRFLKTLFETFPSFSTILETANRFKTENTEDTDTDCDFCNLSVSSSEVSSTVSSTPSSPQTLEISEQTSSNVLSPILCTTWQTAAKFDKKGGCLQKDGSDIVLTIPPDAIDDTDGQLIHKAVCTDVDKIRHTLNISDDEQIASAFVEFYCCAAFSCPVSVSLPHCLPPGYECENVQVYCVTQDQGNAAITFKKIQMMKEEEVEYEEKEEKEEEKEKEVKKEEKEINTENKQVTYSNRRPRHKTPRKHTTMPEKKKIQSRESSFEQEYNDGICFQFLGNDCIEILTHHFTGFFCTYCPGKSRKIDKSRPQLFAMANAETSENGDVDVRVVAWDERIQLADFRQAQGIQGSDETRINLLEDYSLKDSVLQLTIRGCLKPRLDGCNVEKPIFPMQQKREVPKFLACKKCVHKGRLKPFTFTWAMQFPPNRSRYISNTSKTIDIAIDIIHNNADIPKETETTLLLKVQIPPEWMSCRSNPENTFTPEEVSTVQLMNEGFLLQMTNEQLARVAHYLHTSPPSDPIHQRGIFIEWCSFQNQSLLSQAIRTVLLPAGQVHPSEAHQTYQKTFATSLGELRKGPVSGQVLQTPAAVPGAYHPNVSQTALSSIDSRMLFCGPRTFEGYMAGAVQGQVEERHSSNTLSPSSPAEVVYMQIQQGNTAEMRRLQQELYDLRQCLESEKQARMREQQAHLLAEEQARLRSDEQLRLPTVHPFLYYNNSVPGPVPCTSDVSGGSGRPRESDVDLQGRRLSSSESTINTPPYSPPSLSEAANGQDQSGPVMQLGPRDNPEAIPEDCMLMDLK